MGPGAPQAINTHVWGSVTAVDDDSKLPFDSRKSSATNRSTHRTAGRGEGAGAAPARPFTLRLLSIYYFPTGGLPGQPIYADSSYLRRGDPPVVVHCTGRTGMEAKTACMNHYRYLRWNTST